MLLEKEKLSQRSAASVLKWRCLDVKQNKIRLIQLSKVGNCVFLKYIFLFLLNENCILFLLKLFLSNNKVNQWVDVGSVHRHWTQVSVAIFQHQVRVKK